MFRVRSNCRVIEALPRALEEVMVSIPAMVENSRSRIAVTDEACLTNRAVNQNVLPR